MASVTCSETEFSVSDATPGIVRSGAEGALRWVQIASDAPYFVTGDGAAWTPIGHNDAITWPELAGLFRRRDVSSVERHIMRLRAGGVTCLRLMLEYCHREHRYFETAVGQFAPNMVQLWDDLFALCERHGMRVLLTPFDTFWMWRRWKRHPYNRANGGPCARPSRLLLCSATRSAIKGRLSFAAARWGGSGALFAWDLWNEIHPGQAEESADCFDEFIADISGHLRGLELDLYGRSHPHTVSMFGPEIAWRPWLDLAGPIFRNPSLDFATIHSYAEGTIDAPRDTVAPAVSMGTIVRDSLAEIRDGRPFLDTEHGPIYTFKDRHVTLPAAFDDEYFRHMQWAHFASGAAGGGMRWPNRHPHTLTPGMRAAQRSLAAFTPLIDWTRFRRRNVNEEIGVSSSARWARFGCADDAQALVWFLRTDSIDSRGRVRRDAAAAELTVRIPGLKRGRYRVTAWDTTRGKVARVSELEHDGGCSFAARLGPVVTDVAAAVSCVGPV